MALSVTRVTRISGCVCVCVPLLRDLLLCCRLQELPATLGALLGLKALFVGHNQLQQLPGSISRLQLLNTLHAGRELLQCTHVSNMLVVQPCIGQQDVRTSSGSLLTASIWLVTCEL